MIHARDENGRGTYRIVRTRNRYGQVTFPYSKDFQGVVDFVAWNASDPRQDFGFRVHGAVSVVYPKTSDLKLSAEAERETYRPGEPAALQLRVFSGDETPVEASLGIAVVDQAVMERADSNGQFGTRRWFSCAYCSEADDREIGGIRLEDVYARNPEAGISSELDLVAEALLVSHSRFYLLGAQSENLVKTPKFGAMERKIEKLQEALDRHYLEKSSFSRNEADLSAIRDWNTLPDDPWGEPYREDILTERNVRDIIFKSAGPDRRFDTRDDFSVAGFTGEYFREEGARIRTALESAATEPQTIEEFVDILDSAGMSVSSHPDAWGNPYYTGYTNSNNARVEYVVERIVDSDRDGGESAIDVIVSAHRTPRKQN